MKFDVKSKILKNSEMGSATSVVFVTVMFTLMILGTVFTTIALKSKSQLAELSMLKEAYDGDVEAIYKENTVSIVYDYNYLKKNLYSYTTNPSNYGYSSVASASFKRIEDSDALEGYHIEATMGSGASGGVYYLDLINNTLEKGKSYDFSVEIKCSKEVNLSIGHEQNGEKNVTVNDKWQRFTNTFTANDNSDSKFIFYLGSNDLSWNSGDVLYIRSLQIEEGVESQNTSSVVARKNSKADVLKVEKNDRLYYNFDGWYTEPIGGTKINEISDTGENDLKYYAHWKTTRKEIATGLSNITLSGSEDTPIYKSSTLSLKPNVNYILSFDFKCGFGEGNNFKVGLEPENLPQNMLTATTTLQHANLVFNSSDSNMTSCQLRFFDDIHEISEADITITNIKLIEVSQDT